MKYLPALVPLLVCGCGIGSFEYNIDGYETETLASLGAEDIGILIDSDELDTVITAIYDENRALIKEGNPGVAVKLRLQPGTYFFRVRCANTSMVEGGRFNYHTLEVDIAPSRDYVAFCVGRYELDSLGRRIPVSAVAAISEVQKYERDKARLRAKMKSRN